MGRSIVIRIDISVIVPVYNGEKYIVKCIESILKQTFINFEIIIVDDGSVDNTLLLIREFKDNRLKIISKKNEGVSIARNIGIVEAIGKYICFIDSDDYINKNFLEDTYIKAEKEKLDVVVTDYYLYQKEKRYMEDLKLKSNEIISGEDYIYNFFKYDLVGYNCNKLIRKDILIENNIYYRKDIKMMEDTLMLINILRKSYRIGKINKAYYYYVQHDNNTTRNITFKHLQNIELVFSELKRLFFQNKKILNMIEKREIMCTWWIFYYLDNNFEIDYFLKKIVPKIKNINLIKLNISKIAKLKLFTIKYFSGKEIIYILKKINRFKLKGEPKL